MSESPVLPLPPSYTWGFVVARSIRAIADTDQDADRFPEARGSTGRVTFTPLVKFKKHLNTPTAFVHHEVVQARLVDGVLVDAEGHEGVYLISGVYQVSFTIDSGSIPSFPVEVLPEHTLENPLDLVTASPYVSEPGSSTLLLEVPSGHVPGYVLAWGDDGLGWYDPEIVTPQDGAPGAHLEETETPGVFEQNPGIGSGIDVDNTVGTRVFVGGVMVYGDTGVRDVRAQLLNGWTATVFAIQRTTHEVVLTVLGLTPPPDVNGTQQILSAIPGFAPPNLSVSRRTIRGGAVAPEENQNLTVSYLGSVFAYSGQTVSNLMAEYRWAADDTWPTTLPGNPV